MAAPDCLSRAEYLPVEDNTTYAYETFPNQPLPEDILDLQESPIVADTQKHIMQTCKFKDSDNKTEVK